MKKTILLFAAPLLLAGAHLVLNLAPEATIVVESVSPQNITDWGWSTPPSNELSVVGVGELVYLSGAESSGEEVTSYEWDLVGPAGSAAILNETTTEWVTF